MAYVPLVKSMFRNHEDSHLLSSSSCAPQDFHGVSGQFLIRRSMSFSGLDGADQELNPDDMSDDGGSQMIGEKKRRLNLEQVKGLEKSFELGNKLEPERKMQLARALGLQPRQIAIWFQNRRARWKTKQLEKDYDILKRQFEALKSDNDALKSQNKKLKSQLLSMKNKELNFSGCSAINLNKENEGCWSNGSDDNSCDVNLKNKSGVVFPSSITTSPPITSSLTQVLLQNHPASRTSSDHHHHHHPPTSSQLFCNMFGNIEENPELMWSWPPEQHNNFQ